MNRRERERLASEKAKYFARWMRYAGTLKLDKAEQVKRLREHTGKETIAECTADDLRNLLIGLKLNPDEQEAMV